MDLRLKLLLKRQLYDSFIIYVKVCTVYIALYHIRYIYNNACIVKYLAHCFNYTAIISPHICTYICSQLAQLPVILTCLPTSTNTVILSYVFSK